MYSQVDLRTHIEGQCPVVMWSTHIIVVTKVMIQILERVVFLITEKRWTALVTKVTIPLDIKMTHLRGMKLSF